jgi:hypothetical protein
LPLIARAIVPMTLSGLADEATSQKLQVDNWGDRPRERCWEVARRSEATGLTLTPAKA